METAQWAGWVGGIAGAVVGTLGAIIGISCSIRNTDGPRERQFVVRTSFGIMVFVLLFIAGTFLVPNPYRFLLWIPYAVLLVAAIQFGNRRQMQIRREEASQRHLQ